MADVEVSGAIREEIDCGYLETAKEETEGVTCEVDAMEQTSIEAGAVLSHEVEVIDFSEVRLKEIVGSGTFAAVYSAEYRERQIAVKVFNAKASAESLSREIAVVASLRHPNIVGFIGVAWDTANPERPVLAMEFCSMGSLFQALYPNIIDAKTRRGATAGAGHLIDPHRKRIALGTARGMAHLHRVGWAHFDICSPNVLLSEDFDPKLADFGQTRRGFGIGFPAVGHEAYRAPELCFTPSRNYQRSAHWTEKADVYSFAILLWELLHKELPWSGSADISRQVRSGVRPPFRNQELCPRQWRRLIRHAWEECPQDRPSFASIVKTIESLDLPNPGIRRPDSAEDEGR